MEEPKPKKTSHESTGVSGPSGTRAPAKGDSSGGDVPRDTDGTAFIKETSALPPAPGAGAADETFMDASPTPVPGKPRLSEIFPKKNQLQPGDVLGRRFEILEVLGEGGMGAVYKAVDRVVDHIVALKLIRPELAEHPAILARFKQELLTARQVTHRNVIRIHDMSEVDGVKFISMEFVEGCDLRKLLLDRGKLPPEEAVEIIRQVCLALDAAHSAGVIHRDLKPQNIMQDKQGRILVMDFGLARSLESNGMTQTGALLGTFEYMSPEQGMGRQLDQRSDLFAVGLIFYELLTCKLPFKADTAIASLLKRNQERALPAAELDATIPKGLSDIVSKCLERDLNLRYQSAKEILADLDAGRSRSLSTIPAGTVQINLPVVEKRWWYAAGGGMLLLAGLFFAIPKTRHWVFGVPNVGIPGLSANGSPSASQAKFVAVLPFRVLGDQTSLGYVADGLVEATSAKLFQLKDVRLASSTAAAKTDPKTPLSEVAKELGVNLIVRGTVQGSGDNLRVTVNLENAAENRLVWSKEFAGVTGDLLTIEDHIYSQLVDALALKPSNEELARATSHPTENIEAYDLYLRGRNAMGGQLKVGNVETAIGYFEGAIKKDSSFALAYTGLADASLRMYREKKDSVWADKALSASQQAERLNDNLAEVHAALGSVYSATGKYTEAIVELRRALELAPNSDEGYRRLGDAYRASGRKEEAIQAYQKGVEVSPYYWFNWNALGTAYYRFGDNEKALQAFQRVTELEPRNAAAYRNIGAVYFQQNKWNECVPAFQKSLELEQHSATYSNLGTAYFYLKRFDDAIKMFQKALDMKPNYELAVGNLADAYRWSGRKQEAMATYDKAIALAYKDLQVNPRAAATMGNLALYYAKKGDSAHALEFIRRARSIEPENISLLYNQAVVDCLANRREESLSVLEQALQKGYSLEETKNDPELSELQKLPEFAQLLDKFTKKSN